MKAKTWIKGLAAAAISAAATSVTNMIAVPDAFNASAGGLANLGKTAAVSAIIAIALYLKRSPLPEDDSTPTV